MEPFVGLPDVYFRKLEPDQSRATVRDGADFRDLPYAGAVAEKQKVAVGGLVNDDSAIVRDRVRFLSRVRNKAA